MTAQWASKGWDAAEEQAKSSTNYTRDFFLKDGDEATIRVLDAEPFNIRDHYVKAKKGWFTCAGDDCPLCEQGNKATNHFVFNVLDTREWTDKKGETHSDEVKIWRVGIRLLRLLGKKTAKYGPINTYDITVSRLGGGTNTTYDIDVEAKTLDTEAVLPEGQELYDLEEVLAPKSRAELISVATGATPDDDNDEDDDDGGVPWSR
jgi:hypothetical protein